MHINCYIARLIDESSRVGSDQLEKNQEVLSVLLCFSSDLWVTDFSECVLVLVTILYPHTNCASFLASVAPGGLLRFLSAQLVINKSCCNFPLF